MDIKELKSKMNEIGCNVSPKGVCLISCENSCSSGCSGVSCSSGCSNSSCSSGCTNASCSEGCSAGCPMGCSTGCVGACASLLTA